MKNATAQRICAEWYNGQWSALYSFASTGIFDPARRAEYLEEITTCNPTTQKQRIDLFRLKIFFETQQ